jgi:membrane protein
MSWNIAGIKKARRFCALAWFILRESVLSFSRNEGFSAAATLAYFGFFALLPLLLILLIGTSALLFSSQTVLHALESELQEVFPHFSGAILRAVFTLSQQRIWGLLSIVILLWSIMPFAAAIRSAFRRVFRAEKRHAFLTARLLDFLAVLLLLAALFILVTARIAYGSGFAHPPLLPYVAFLRPVAGWLLPFGIATLTLAFFYATFAPGRPGIAPVAAGALAAAALLFVTRPAFGFVLQFNPQSGFAFGSLKTIFLVMVWVYYALTVMLFGAEIMANTRRRAALLLRRVFTSGAQRFPESDALLAPFTVESAAGTVLFREGDPGDALYYVLAGTVALSRNAVPLGTVAAGAYVGEMALLRQAPRTETAVVAAPAARLIVISDANFDVILRENPAIVRAILGAMADRLQRANDALLRG